MAMKSFMKKTLLRLQSGFEQSILTSLQRLILLLFLIFRSFSFPTASTHSFFSLPHPTFCGQCWCRLLFMRFCELAGELLLMSKNQNLIHKFHFHSNTREESCESALIIHKILQNKPAFMVNDESFYSKMKSFTLQILHRKKVENHNWNHCKQFIIQFAIALTSKLKWICFRFQKVFHFHGLGLFKLDYTFIFSVNIDKKFIQNLRT